MEELEESLPDYPWDSHTLEWYNKVAVSQDKSIICRRLIIQANDMSYGASGNARNDGRSNCLAVLLDFLIVVIMMMIRDYKMVMRILLK